MKLLLWKWKWGAWVNGHNCWELVLKSFAIDTWSNGIYRHRVLLSNPAMEDLSSMVHSYGQRERKKSCMSKNSQFFDKSILIRRVSLFSSGTRFSKAYMFLRLSPCLHFFVVYGCWVLKTRIGLLKYHMRMRVWGIATTIQRSLKTSAFDMVRKFTLYCFLT